MKGSTNDVGRHVAVSEQLLVGPTIDALRSHSRRRVHGP